MGTLYDINTDLREALTAFSETYDPETGEVLDEANFAELDAKVEALALSREEKIDGTGVIIKEEEGYIATLDGEIKRLQARKKRFQSHVDHLMDNVKKSMLAFGETKLETPRSIFSFRKSEQTIVTDESLLDDKYIKVVIESKPDLVAIKKAIKEAEKKGETFEGARIEVKQNLQIK